MRNTRRDVIIGSAALAVGLEGAAAMAAGGGSLRLFVATGGRSDQGGGGKGLYSGRFDPATGAFTPLSLAAEIANPLYICASRDHRYLYSAMDAPSTPGGKSSDVTAFAIDDLALRKLNALPGGGLNSMILTTDSQNRNLLYANFMSGEIVCRRLQPDGSVGPITSEFLTQGDGDKRTPRARSVALSPSERYALVVDFGLDRVVVYRFDADTGVLTYHSTAQIPVGSGPRQLAFHPNGRFVYLTSEFASTLTVFHWDEASGTLTLSQTLATLPAGAFSGTNTAAGLAIHPNGRVVYASNRGFNSVAIFDVDDGSGALRLRKVAPLTGGTPWDIVLVGPGRRWMLVANHETGSVSSVRVDPDNGELSAEVSQTPVTMPSCLVCMA